MAARYDSFNNALSIDFSTMHRIYIYIYTRPHSTRASKDREIRIRRVGISIEEIERRVSQMAREQENGAIEK